jgi:NAD(P)-dependent dehydrogenase (short-subunit alcohol dehydrogenase family)
MRVIVVGATGTIGKAIVEVLEGRHEIVRVAHTRGDYRVDIASRDSIQKLYDAVGSFDAMVSAAGLAKFGALESLTDADFQVGWTSKLMGQINLVRLGLSRARDGGSFTLTSGVLASEPTPGSAAISPVNAGVEAFARAAALETARGIRINAVSPPWVSETLASMGRDHAGGLPAAKVAAAYLESVEGRANGEVLDARRFA